MTNNISIEELTSFCKRKGFVYPSGDIYGGLSGFFDFGPLGVELKNNIKREWWKFFVHQREDMVGIDGAIITHPQVWKASGHVENFDDFMLTCSSCKEKFRADTLAQDVLHIDSEGLTKQMLEGFVEAGKLACPNCKKPFDKIEDFNLMFSTHVGPQEATSSRAYLRPETAQLIFTNFKLVAENARMKLPFGIAQMGKAFRNEISPRDFLFRCREFEQMEIEYFIHPDKQECPYLDTVVSHKLRILTSEMQESKTGHIEMTVSEALEKKYIHNQWHAYWLALLHKWFVSLGAFANRFRIRQHLKHEKSHYASDTWDLEYEFPFGWKELLGVADRTTFDLDRHSKHSKKDLSLFDEESKSKIVPHVIAEPSIGLERALLVFLFDAYDNDEKRGNIVLHLHRNLSPITIGVYPLVNKLKEKAKGVFDLLKSEYHCTFDSSGSIGRRYARADEQGTFLGCTVDFDSLKDESVTLRDRDSTKQIRVEISKLKEVIRQLISGKPFDSF